MASTSSSIGPAPVCIDTRWRPVGEMSRLLDAAQSWVETHARRSGYKPELRRIAGGQWRWCYPPACYALLQRERADLMRHPPIGDRLTVKQSATKLHCDEDWVYTTMAEHSMWSPRPCRLANNRLADTISRDQHRRLRRLRRRAPHGWHTERRLAKLTGWDSHTVRVRLGRPAAAAAGITSEWFLCANGRSERHYSPGAEDYLGHKPKDIPPGGDWLTLCRMAPKVRRSEEWLRRRLNRPHYRAAAQIRLDDWGRPQLHYPPWVCAELELESQRLRDAEHTRHLDQAIRRITPRPRRHAASAPTRPRVSKP